MIGVGIHENVVIDNVEVNDARHLIITFRAKQEKSLFEDLDGAEYSEGDNKSSLRLFPFKVPDKADLTETQKVDRVINDIRKIRNQCIHILGNFLTKADINLDQYAGTGLVKGVSDQEFKRKMLSQNVLDKIWQNTCVNFIRLMKPICGRDDLAIRLKLIRQSKEKHFPAFPDRFLDRYPFIEPMVIDKKQSKVVFTDWEIKEGRDKADQI